MESAIDSSKAIVLENEVLRVAVSSESGCFDALDKVSGVAWCGDPWRQSTGELVLKNLASGKTVVIDLADAGALRVEEIGPNRIRLAFGQFAVSDPALRDAAVTTELELSETLPELTATVAEVKFDSARHALVSVLYPGRQFPLFSEQDEGYLAIPFNQGSIIPSNRFKVPLRNDWHIWDDLSWQSSGLAWGTEGAYGDVPVYGWNALSMPWFGAVKDNAAYVAVLDTDNDAQMHFCLNYNLQDDYDKKPERSPLPRIAVASSRWLSVKGAFAYPRRVTYRFLPGGTHVDMAKHYRGVAEKKGLIVRLKDKMKERPQLKDLLGATLINIDGGYPWYTDYKSMMYTWNDLKAVVQDIHDNLGVRKAMICTWGGYSKLPPESYPFHPDWGTEQELRDVVDQIHDYGWLYCTYHGYPSNLPHADNFDAGEAAIRPDGSIGGRWGARCSATQLKHAQRDLPRIFAVTGQKVDYTDIVTAGPLRECYHADHGQTRAQDRESRLNILRHIRSLGVVNGSEVAQGYIAADVDYSKGGMYVGQRYFLLKHIHAPLFSLVFHDCMVCFDGTVGTSRAQEMSPETLECIAYGIQPNLSFNMAHYAGARETIQQISALTADFLESVALEELVDHAYLGGGYDVQRTRFASGARVTVNTDTAPYVDEDGLETPARGFVIEQPGRAPRKGAIQTSGRWIDEK